MLSPAAAGFRARLLILPRARGLALGYTLPPASRACTGICGVIIIGNQTSQLIPR